MLLNCAAIISIASLIPSNFACVTDARGLREDADGACEDTGNVAANDAGGGGRGKDVTVEPD